MNQNFETLMASKTNEVLQEYIVNSGKYQRDAVSAAIDELKKRGKTFDDGQLAEIYQKVQAKEDEANKGGVFFDKKTTTAYWKRNIVLDTDAPPLYSERAIFGFSIFFAR